MTDRPTTGACWSTASFGDSTDTSPLELSALGAHLTLCQKLSGRLFAWQCGAEAVNGFVAARLMTTLALLAVVIGAAWLLG